MVTWHKRAFYVLNVTNKSITNKGVQRMEINIQHFGNLQGKPKELVEFCKQFRTDCVRLPIAKDIYHDYKAVAEICNAHKAQDYYKPGDIMFTKHPMGWLEGQITWRIIKVLPGKIYLLATRPVCYMPFDYDELSKDKDGNPNPHKYAIDYGLNRWDQSAARQWLNSKAPKGEWWKQQHPWDAKTDDADKCDSFMLGMQDDFMELVTPYRAVTLCTDGGSTVTTDMFWLPSITEMTGECNGDVMEGKRLFYDKLPTGFSLRLRSPNPSYSNYVYYVHTSGFLNDYHAYSTGNGLAPACVIGDNQ